MLDLCYGSNPGCVVRVSNERVPSQCGGNEAAAIPHHYRYPRPHATRLYVCSWHAESEPTAEPLTDEDQRVIAERRARRDAQLAPARARAREAERQA